MININICSLFRDSQYFNNIYINQISNYFNQLKRQKLLKEIKINKIICVEGNSQDDTLETLKKEKNKKEFNIEIIKQESKYNSVKSTADNQRIKELSNCGTIGLEFAQKQCDFIFFIESDLIIYDDFLLYKLFKSYSKIDNLGIIAPIITLDTNPTYFYDTWAFRNIDNTNWNNNWIWSTTYTKYQQYIPMLSIGSCALIKADLVRSGCNFYDGAFVELCRQIKCIEHEVYCDKKNNVYHPSKLLVCGRWI